MKQESSLYPLPFLLLSALLKFMAIHDWESHKKVFLSVPQFLETAASKGNRITAKNYVFVINSGTLVLFLQYTNAKWTYSCALKSRLHAHQCCCLVLDIHWSYVIDGYCIATVLKIPLIHFSTEQENKCYR